MNLLIYYGSGDSHDIVFYRQMGKFSGFDHFRRDEG